MKHILFLSYDGMTDPLGQSQVIPYLKGLTQYGYRFTILSCDKRENYLADKNYVDELLNGLPIKWISIPYHKKPKVLSSLYDHFKLRKMVIKLHHQYKFDLVHTRPGLPTLAALWMKKKYEVPFLNDIRGFWADERVDGGMWDRKNPLYNLIYKFFKRHEEECLNKADHNICLTYAAEKILREKNGNSEPGITVIPCSVDKDLFDPGIITYDEKFALRSKLGIHENDIVFSYLGSIGGWYMTDEMMNFFKVAQDKFTNSKFLFISPHRHEEIRKIARSKGIDKERLITISAKRHEVPLLLSTSDYSTFFIKPCFSKLSSSPTKHGEIMSMGIPVITNSGVGDVSQIVKEFDAGYVINKFWKEEYERVIHDISQGRKFNNPQIVAGAEEYYSLNKAVIRYGEVYRKIFEG